MEAFSLINIIIIAVAAAALILGAVLHKRALKKAVAGCDNPHVRGLRRNRHQ
ncbi:MAG: hypothetical protein GAK35_01142 [Herbaspirillum frisingense]|uniref:FeoB-associated Cys-rich membrane protein n=1 Tax=Herbaspirillum frisingense TaxID=92645 RepID=A0A7V8FYL3_9BURK|nr:MAG: hypothetical protein GAK35_01142 [Herbaspirillum frisingense]